MAPKLRREGRIVTGAAQVYVAAAGAGSLVRPGARRARPFEGGGGGSAGPGASIVAPCSGLGSCYVHHAPRVQDDDDLEDPHGSRDTG